MYARRYWLLRHCRRYVVYLGCFDFAIHRTRFVIFDGVLFDEIEK